MGHSPEELLRKIGRIYNEPELVGIVNMCGHPSTAEEMAEKIEYPTSLLREVRYAGILKRDFPDVYVKTFPKVTAPTDVLKGNRTRTKRFSCNWTASENNEFELAGTMEITPHAFLPPLFWDYELFFEENNELVFSSKTTIPDHKRTNIRCIFAEGSRSIPVGLLLVCNRYSDEFNFRRTITNEETYWWSRTSPEGNRLSGLKGEIFHAGIDEKPYNNLRRQVSLRTLSKKEEELLESFDTQHIPNRINYHFILAEELWYPDNEGKSLLYSLEMRYKPESCWRKRSGGVASLVTFKLPFHNSPYGGPDYKILTSVFHADNPPDHARKREKFADRVAKMLQGTPNQIKFLPTLENFFSFKRNSDFFELYNEGHHWDPLVLAQTEAE